jgi:ABC-2 type transport system permease protein
VRNLFAVARREFRAYFDSPIAYVLLVASLAFWSFWFFRDFFLQGQATLRGFFGLLPWTFLFLASVLTMRLWAEERRLKTEELLFTWPVRPGEVVLGKFAAALALLVLTLLLSLPLAITADALGPLDWGPVLAGYLGAILLGAACLALGLFFSSLTENQIVAAILTLVVLFAFLVVGLPIVVARSPATLAPVLEYVGFKTHYDSVARGVLDVRDVFFFALATAVFLRLNAMALAWRRWRG